MGRRQVVASANASLKGAFANLSLGFFRVRGLVKQTILLGFTLAAYNLDRVRSFRAKHRLDDNGHVIGRPKERRVRRSTATWTDVIEAGPGSTAHLDAANFRRNSRTSVWSALARAGPALSRSETRVRRAGRQPQTSVRPRPRHWTDHFHEQGVPPIGNTPT
jgi:hypothetical protein